MRIRTLLGTQRDRFVVHRTVGLLGAVACALLLLASAQAAQAATISVNTTNDELNSDGDCSLREAIRSANTGGLSDTCAVGGGADTIDVPPGTYLLTVAGPGEDRNVTGDLDITSDLTIKGAGASSTIIDGAALDRVFDIRYWSGGTAVDISGLTVQGGNRVTDDVVDSIGGGIRSWYSTAPVTLSDTRVIGNTATYGGGGIYSAYGTLTLNDSTVSGNRAADGTGGGITGYGGGPVTLNNSTVSDNSSHAWAGGIYASGIELMLNNSTVSGNTTGERGYWAGGIYLYAATATINKSTVSDNTADDGGGIFSVAGLAPDGSSEPASVTLIDSIVRGNRARSDGGGIYSQNRNSASSSAILVVQDSTVAANTAAEKGGGIYNTTYNMEGSALATLNGSTVEGNTAGLSGGGIYNFGRSATTNLNASTVTANTATQEGGGLWVDSEATLEARDSTVNGNSADTNGGGAWSAGNLELARSAVSGNTAGSFGGGIYQEEGLQPGLLELEQTNVSDNSAERGGGIYNFTGATAAITKSAISDNTATGVGGGVVNWEDLTIKDSTLSGNSGTLGGAIHHHFGTTSVENSTISANQATRGGGLIGHDAGDVSLKSTTVANNTASEAGGGIYKAMATVSLKDTIVANNTLNQSSNDCGGSIASQGHNLDSDGSCGLAGGGDISGADPLLGPLADNGGPTRTHALLAGSPAIDGGGGGCPPPATDQRGISRPQGDHCDIGAFEEVADKDGDGLSFDREVELSTDPDNPDTDSDSCGDGVELGPSPAEGGKRNPLSFWDFMDVPTGSSLARDRAVAGGDISAVVARFGANDDADNDGNPDPVNRDSDPVTTAVPPAPVYHPAYDRGGTIVGQDPWDLKPPNGAVDGGDIAATVVQFGHSCVGS